VVAGAVVLDTEPVDTVPGTTVVLLESVVPACPAF